MSRQFRMTGWCGAAGWFALLAAVAINAFGLTAAEAVKRDRPCAAGHCNDYPGHLWRETAPAVRTVLAGDPRLWIEVLEDPNALASFKADDWDVVVCTS